MSISITKNKSVDEFLEVNSGLLYQDESLNNLLLGLVTGIKDKKIDCPDASFYTVMDNELAIGSAIQTHLDKPLAISKVPINALGELAKYIKKDLSFVNEVVGESVTSDLLTQKISSSRELVIHLGVYKLNEIIMPDIKECSLIEVSEEHRELAFLFVRGFIADCFPRRDAEKEARQMMARYLKNKSLYLLKNESGEIVSMAGKARETKNAVTVSLVYTPPEYRRRGYGEIVTALVSRKFLNEGKKECNLFTDLMNPTSNSIYQKIGYKKIGESKHYRL